MKKTIHKKMKKLKGLSLLLYYVVISLTLTAQHKFEPTVSSLKHYETPDWFRDAKFGIYIHWGGQSVDGVADWYARTMYNQGSKAYKYHVKTFGHPSEVGYKEVLKRWKADQFDADRLVRLVKQSGAKYFTPCAVHHDNFDLWNSKYQQWNATEVGPKQDLIGKMHRATKKHGLRWGVTTHLARSYSWFQTSHGSDNSGSKKGVPYDGQNPRYWRLYHPHSDDWNAAHPKNPPKSWRIEWKLRLKDLIQNYDPDLLYFDSAIPFEGKDNGQTGMELLAYYYNNNMKRHGGSLQAVMTSKTYDSKDHGREIPGATTIDFERGRSNQIRSQPWQTDASVGPWYWMRDADYRSAREIVHELVDIVSKRGNLLLNIPPRPNGELDPEVVKLLKSIGQWLEVNGEAIYETRPWEVYGEGPSVETQQNLNLHAQVPDINYSAEDVRYTRSKDGKTLNVFVLGWPEEDLTLQQVVINKAGSNTNVKLLGYESSITYSINQNNKITIEVPKMLEKRRPCKHAYCFQLTGFDVTALEPY